MAAMTEFGAIRTNSVTYLKERPLLKAAKLHVTSGCWPLLTYCNAVIVTENHLRFVIGRHIANKRLDKRLQVSCTRY